MPGRWGRMGWWVNAPGGWGVLGGGGRIAAAFWHSSSLLVLLGGGSQDGILPHHFPSQAHRSHAHTYPTNVSRASSHLTTKHACIYTHTHTGTSIPQQKAVASPAGPQSYLGPPRPPPAGSRGCCRRRPAACAWTHQPGSVSRGRRRVKGGWCCKSGGVCMWLGQVRTRTSERCWCSWKCDGAEGSGVWSVRRFWRNGWAE